MEKSLSDPRAEKLAVLRLILGATPAQYRSWLEQGQVYLEKGYANEDLLTAFVYLARWRCEADRKPLYQLTKRLFDFSVAAVAVVAAFPLLFACAFAVKISSPGPIFFKQLRIGYLGRPFWILKFRTMHHGADSMVDPRKEPLTKPKLDTRSSAVGRFLRKWKLDELPQLLNVLLGDMSLVGPRPLPVEESAITPPDHLLRFAAVPGLTGLWQATVPNTVPASVKLALDCEYVQKRGWGLDLKLILMTVPRVLKGEDHA